jgi:diguanylate cyclase (GGDEF)-like protein
MDWSWAVTDMFVPIFYLMALRAFDNRDNLEHRLAAAAEIDPLTQIPNRAGFYAQAALLLDAASRDMLPLTIAMFDVDRFKLVNDGWGHAAGDTVLRGLALIVRTSLRDGDVYARYGGEEFILLVKGMTPVEALPLVERLRSAITKGVPHPSGEQARVTVSVGLAPVEAYHTTALEAAIRRSDEALYAAKNAGRDRTVIAAASI